MVGQESTRMLLDMTTDKIVYKRADGEIPTIEDEETSVVKKKLLLSKTRDTGEVKVAALNSRTQHWVRKEADIPGFKYQGLVGIGPKSEFFNGLNFSPGQRKIGIRLVDYFEKNAFKDKASGNSVCDFGFFDIEPEKMITFPLSKPFKDSWKFTLESATFSTSFGSLRLSDGMPLNERMAYPSITEEYIVLNQATADAINADLGAVWDETEKAYRLADCIAWNSAKDIVTLVLNGNNFSLSFKSTVVVKKGKCFSGFNRAEGNEEGLVLGIPFLKSFYVGLDYDQESVSFSPNVRFINELGKSEGMLNIIDKFQEVVKLQLDINEEEKVMFKDVEVVNITKDIRTTHGDIGLEIAMLRDLLLRLKAKAGDTTNAGAFTE
ncbi:hypothetical protein HDV02_005682 [Globomyces sp. JEL0801]|nr:hypothetical protein HDV02_005682 [Globomyces sp. JEL0801]